MWFEATVTFKGCAFLVTMSHQGRRDGKVGRRTTIEFTTGLPPRTHTPFNSPRVRSLIVAFVVEYGVDKRLALHERIKVCLRSEAVIIIELDIGRVHSSVVGAARGWEGNKKTNRLDGPGDHGSRVPF